ncbi:MAG: hypothetical protein KF823_00985 [Xanthomonadales bacterium]|nr:hypothetical protein [Xanthomonadales bacterium]
MSTRATYVACLMAVVCLLLSGCARLTSIHRTANLPGDKPHAISVDAKQRMVLTQPWSNQHGTVLRICAEPPPDAFTALATSVGAEASVSGEASADIAAKLATSLSENAATIERSQTINVLREFMYRNCERYLSGAIDSDEFVVQAARDQQLIVQVLAIEQLTGASRAQAAVLTTMAQAAASGVSDASLEILAAARSGLEAAQATSDKALVDANGLPPVGHCPALPIDPAAPPAGVTAAQATAKNDACAAAKVTQARTSEAQAHLAVVQDAVARQADVGSMAAGQMSSAARDASQASSSLARHVVDIVKQNHVFDEIVMACVVQLRRGNVSRHCEEILSQSVGARQAQLLSLESRFDPDLWRRVGQLVPEIDASAEAVLSWLVQRGGNNAANWDTLQEMAGHQVPRPILADLIAAGVDRARFAVVFARLSQPIADALRMSLN